MAKSQKRNRSLQSGQRMRMVIPVAVAAAILVVATALLGLGHIKSTSGAKPGTASTTTTLAPASTHTTFYVAPGQLLSEVPPALGVGTGNAFFPLGDYVEHFPGNSGPLDPSHPGSTLVGPPWYGIHYTLQITAVSGQSFAGELYFTYVGPGVGNVFTFTGVASPDWSNATVTVTSPPQQAQGMSGYYQSTLGIGAKINAPISNRAITLDGCNSYLHWLLPSDNVPSSDASYDCQFNYMGGSPTYPYP